jgi:hypothetical protein
MSVNQSPDQLFEVVDVYSMSFEVSEPPFTHDITLCSKSGQHSHSVEAVFDAGAMISAMSLSNFNRIKDKIGGFGPSSKLLRVANGTVTPSVATWQGVINIKGISIPGEVEVLDSGGSWEFLLGKPMLRQLRALQDFEEDSVTIRSAMPAPIQHTLQSKRMTRPAKHPKGGNSSTNPPSREVPTTYQIDFMNADNQTYLESEDDLPFKSITNFEISEHILGGISTPSRGVDSWNLQLQQLITDTNDIEHINHVQYEDPTRDSDWMEEFRDNNPTTTPNIFTRQSPEGPFHPPRVQRIIDEIKIGTDLTDNERTQITNLVREFADIFALSVSEVIPIPGAVHKLNIPSDIKFPTKVHQRPLTPAQRKFLDAKVDEMLAASVIEPIHPRDVRFAAPTVLAKKTHTSEGHSLEELQRIVDRQCVALGEPPTFNTEPSPVNDLQHTPSNPETKWRVCQNYSAINKHTEIAPVPQGDIRTKQQRLSGHRWISTFDFASGFYAITVHPDSRPYICFFVEGRGYFAYTKMPFGLTGAPSEFGHTTGRLLHDLIADGTMELFVDDGGSVCDTFDEGMRKVRAIFLRARKAKLSISATKLQLFMSQATFGGASVGKNGVQPDLAKLAAIVEWKQPEDALNLSSFLGLAGWFRDLIFNFAKIEGPLRDLVACALANLPPNPSKTAYRTTLRNFKLASHWSPIHSKAFLQLKTQLTSEPVLRAPRYDGTPFTVTTDGSKDAFAGVLTQELETTLPNGKVVKRTHPIAFASKRTSLAESKYKPFMLEFAALKYALDHFDDIIWGSQIKIRTDCKALKDVLLSDKLNATHARWRDSVIAHAIIDIQHLPGHLNVVADPLSRKWEGQPRREGDGSEWTVQPEWTTPRGLIQDLLTLMTDKECIDLQYRFRDEKLFREVLESLLQIDNPDTSSRNRQKAHHRAQQYFISEGKLWRVGGGIQARGRSKRECITKLEARSIAFEQHVTNGHWHRDALKVSMLDKYCSPKLDESIVTAISECPQCKNFGATHLHALLNPITRRHPFELLVGDYLSLPMGKGGHKNVLLLMDVFSQHIWGFKYKTAGSAKTTNTALGHVFHEFKPPEVFMTDGGSHFKNKEVANLCASWGTQVRYTAAYSPWINGLVEGTNKLLLHVLSRLCAPQLGEDDMTNTSWEALPKTWPDHLDHAIRILNWRILPALKFSPKELLLGLIVNTPPTDTALLEQTIKPSDAELHIAYVAQQRLDGYSEAVDNAMRRKRAFDRKVIKSKAGVVNFTPGELVQVYRSELMHTMRSERKLLPRWSQPYRIREQLQNSYRLETLDGSPLEGTFSARRLRSFRPRPGTLLADEQHRALKAAGNKPLPAPGGADNLREGEDWHEGEGEKSEDEDEDEGEAGAEAEGTEQE